MRNAFRRAACCLLPWGLLFLLVESVPAQTIHFSRLDTYVEKGMRDWQIPGLALGIVQNDSLLYARGYGVRELGKPGRVDEHTLFAIASNTKAFTASVLGMLVAEGKLNWDDRVIDYMKDFRMDDPYVTREIRIRDLLTHRSGLPTFGGDHLWIGNTLTREEIISRIRYLKPIAPFRSEYHYQNLMFLVAGQIIPRITGKSWDEEIVNRIFIPLGMQESNTSIRDLKNAANVATPHEIVEGKLIPIAYDNVDNVAPAGAINSNVVDMSKWMRMNLNQGKFAGKQILPVPILREMQRIQFPLPVSPFNEKNLGMRFAGYGFGWGVSEYKGRKMISHSGGLSGMISLQTLLPEEHLGVIVLTNFAPNSFIRAVTYRILDAFLGEPERDWNAVYLERKRRSEARQQKMEATLRAKRAKNTRPTHPLTAFAGTYFDPLSGEATVRLQNGKLLFDYNPRYRGELEHWHYDTFRVHWHHPIFDMQPKTFLTFLVDENGEVSGLQVTFYDPIFFRKIQ